MKTFLYLELFLVVILGFVISYKVAEKSNTIKKEVYTIVKKSEVKKELVKTKVDSESKPAEIKNIATIGKIFKKYGYVFLNNKKTNLSDVVSAGDIIKTSAYSYVILKFSNGAILRINPNSKIKIENLENTKDDTFKVQLLIGSMLSHFSKRGKFKINTETATVGVRGTTFFTETLAKKQTVICACHGEINFYNKGNKKGISSDHHQVFSLKEKGFVKNIKSLVPSVKTGHNDDGIAELKRISKRDDVLKESTFDYMYSKNNTILKSAIELIEKKKGKKAIRVLGKISRKDAYASFLIGKVLYEGIGIKKDKKFAVKWLKISAKKKFPAAVDYLSAL